MTSLLQPKPPTAGDDLDLNPADVAALELSAADIAALEVAVDDAALDLASRIKCALQG